ncbi:hypothetical protein D030_0059, partial [Vibrio parahaemolyticus AQ3810]
MACLSI